MDCIARVAARATGTSVEAFKVFAAIYQPAPQRKPPYTERLLYAYLLHHGFLCGLRFVDPQLCGYTVPRGEYDVSGSDAYVVVQSENPRWQHALYWDSQSRKLLDLTDGGDTPVPIGKHPIKLWVPIERVS